MAQFLKVDVATKGASPVQIAVNVDQISRIERNRKGNAVLRIAGGDVLTTLVPIELFEAKIKAEANVQVLLIEPQE